MDDDKEGTVILTKPVETGTKAEGTACLILLHPPGSEIGRKTVLINAEYVIGRDTRCELPIVRDAVSRKHAKLAQQPNGSWVVSDLGSTNGTFVNEQRINNQPLFDGDQIRFGDAIFKFLSGENIESAYHEEIFQMTINDGLTGVHNKRYFLDFLEREMASAHRHGNPLSLVMMDIDHFKQVNDTYGHLCGDEVLKSVAGRIQQRIRREDLFARYGGEEFAAVLTCTALEGAVHFAEHIRNLVAAQPCKFGDQEIPVTLSLGVATVHMQDLVTVDAMIAAADSKLYEAKHAGRNRVAPPFVDVAGLEE